MKHAAKDSSDQLWETIKPMIPTKEKPKKGRPLSPGKICHRIAGERILLLVAQVAGGGVRGTGGQGAEYGGRVGGHPLCRPDGRYAKA